jgi:exopolysaccharide biosynthesis polyprenyl glycosylphosphotransferase
MKPFFFPESYRRFLYRLILFAGDFLCVGAALKLGYSLRFHWPEFIAVFPPVKGVPPEEFYFPFQIIAGILLMFSFHQTGFYRRLHLHFSDEILRVLHAVAKGWLMILAVTFLYREAEYSRLVAALSAVLCFAFVLAERWLARLFFYLCVARWWEPQRVLVLGQGRMAQSVMSVLRRNPEISPECRHIVSPDELHRWLKDNTVREVFAGEPDLDHLALMAMSDVCDEAGIPFKVVPDLLELRMGEILFDDSLGLPTFSIRPASLTGATFLYKRCFDILLSILLISIFFFPLIFIAFLIYLDSPGPILFHQLRMGFKGGHFPFFKFRSMILNADRYLEELKKFSDRPGSAFKMKNDPRITRVGRWLRKFSVDEMPQILNVLRGEMSLVGPRPQVLWEAAAYDDWAKKRLNVLPGITGLWQVSGRARLSFEQMIELDVYYIEHWSPGLDLKILFRTLPTVLGGQGAY